MHRTLVLLAAILASRLSLSAEPLGPLFYRAEERARLPEQARYGLDREASSLHWAGRIQHRAANGTRHHTDWINGRPRRDLVLPSDLKPGQRKDLPFAAATPPPGATE